MPNLQTHTQHTLIGVHLGWLRSVAEEEKVEVVGKGDFRME